MKAGRYLFRLIKNYPGYFFIAVIISVFFQCLNLIPGMVSREIFDVLNKKGEAHLNIGILLVLLAMVPVIGLFAGQLVLYLSETFKYLVSGLLRKNIFIWILKMPGAQVIKGTINEAQSRFRDDVDDIAQCITTSITAVSFFIFSIFSLVIMMKINAMLTMFTVLPIIAILLIIKKIEKRLRRYRKDSRESIGKVTNFIGEVLNSVQSIKIYNSEAQMISQLKELNKDRQIKSLKDRVLNETLNLFSGNSVHISLGIILLFGCSMMKNGNFTVGDFALFEYYLWFVGALPYWIGELYKSYKQTPISFERLIAIFDNVSLDDITNKTVSTYHEKSLKLSRPAPLDLLEVKELSFNFSNNGFGIEDISFKVPKNSLTVITGVVGSGKSTLVRVLIGLLKKDSGHILWNGKRIEESSEFFLPPTCGYTPQIPMLFNRSIKENILMGADEKNVDINKVLFLSALDVDIREFENGLDTVIGVNGTKLSGGQRKRLAIARMLAQDPALIVIDDFSSSIDIDTEQVIRERLLKEKKYTCILVSHRRTALELADNIIMLEKGRICACGTISNVSDKLLYTSGVK